MFVFESSRVVVEFCLGGIFYMLAEIVLRWRYLLKSQYLFKVIVSYERKSKAAFWMSYYGIAPLAAIFC